MKWAKTLDRYSPTILTCMGAIGVVATAVTAVRATPKAMKLCEALRLDCVNDYQEEPRTIDYVKEAWKCYIPSTAIGLATIACIFCANGLNKRQQAALTSAYIFLDQSYKEYRKKVNELYGDNSDREIRKEIAIEKSKEVDLEPPSDYDKRLFYEPYFGQAFERTMLEVLDAEYKLNQKLAMDGKVSLNDFFELLGLSKTSTGKFIGWSQENSFDFYNYTWIEFEHELVRSEEDGTEYYVINMPFPPVYGFDTPF